MEIPKKNHISKPFGASGALAFALGFAGSVFAAFAGEGGSGGSAGSARTGEARRGEVERRGEGGGSCDFNGGFNGGLMAI